MTASRLVLVVVVAMAVLAAGCNPFADDESGIAIVSRDGELRWLVSDTGSCGFGRPKWSGNGDYAVVLKGCSESIQLLGLSREGDELWTIDFDSGSIASPNYMVSPDGHELAVATYQHKPGRIDAFLHVGPPGGPLGEPVASFGWDLPEQNFIPALWSYQDFAYTADGNYIVGLTSLDGTTSDFIVFDRAGGWSYEVIETSADEVGPIAVANDSLRVASPTGGTDGTVGLVVVDIEMGAWNVVADDLNWPSYIDWAPDGERVVVSSNQGAVIIDTSSGENTPLAGDYQWSEGVSWSATGEIAVAHQDVLSLADIHGNHVREIIDRGEGTLRNPQWSPDGTEILVEVRPPYRD
ncbi:MAG: hypothetical protein KC495_00870 [Dehalococcoidia bacterium]|nr:hypothetical protein [Dehalococcoidia bacterium]